MAYEKNTWAKGDTITSEKLNHLEDGVESNALPENAQFGYDIPGQLLLTITEADTQPVVFNPAVIELVVDTQYTFKIVDEFHPDGVVLSDTAFKDKESDLVIWECGAGQCFYEISYDPDNQSNVVAATFDYGEQIIYIPAEFYTVDQIHKIPEEYLDVTYPPATIDIVKSSAAGNYHCAYTASELLNYVLAHKVSVRLVINFSNYDTHTQQVYIASAVIGNWGREFSFNGVDVFFDRFDGSSNSWYNYKITLGTDGTITGSTYSKTLTTS